MKTITFDETKWKLVPVDPTLRMLDAGWGICGGDSHASAQPNRQKINVATANYSALLAAISTPPDADSMPMPQNEDQAAAMALLGHAWLRDNAPHRLNQQATEHAAPAVPQGKPLTCQEQQKEWADYINRCDSYDPPDRRHAFLAGLARGRTLAATSPTPSQPAVPYSADQWWAEELDTITGGKAGLTLDQYRAVEIARQFIKSKLPAPPQEPVAEVTGNVENHGRVTNELFWHHKEPLPVGTNLYIVAPSQPVTLTEEEICECFGIDGADDWVFKGAHAVIAALHKKGVRK